MGEDDSGPTLGELYEQNRAGTTPVSVRVPDPLLDELDELSSRGGYETRSEFVRAVLREVTDSPEAFDVVAGERHAPADRARVDPPAVGGDPPE